MVSGRRLDHLQDFLAARGGHYLFTVKINQPLLRQALMRLPWPQAPGTRRRGRGHGCTESRSIKVIDLDRADAQALFPYARRAIKVVRRRRIGARRPSVEVVYAITSLDYRAADPRLLAGWLQGHWAIEHSVHHIRDVTQREDASRIRLGAGPQLMAASTPVPAVRSATRWSWTGPAWMNGCQRPYVRCRLVKLEAAVFAAGALGAAAPAVT